MAKSRSAAKIYQRGPRFYGDFREYAAEGGGREALTPAQGKRATTDPAVASKLYADRLAALDRKRQLKHLHGIEKEESLKRYAAYHLIQKARDREGTQRWLVEAERHLNAAVEFFGAEADLRALTPDDCTTWVNHLRRMKGRRDEQVSDSTVRKYLNSLSNLYSRAVSERYVDRNPVADMYSKPTEETREAAFLDGAEAALLLESARTLQPNVDGGAYPYIYPLLATFLLTGGRKSEVLGLELDDLSFRHGKIYFRPNDWRRLKTKGSKRTVPLWPQLEEILRAYLVLREQTDRLGSLLFPSDRVEEEQMLSELRKALNQVARRAGFPAGHIRLHMLRHTYTAARIQTCDRGRPVSLYTVARELGHNSTGMIEDRYGHLHDRAEAGGAEVVEFRVESHRKALGDRLKALKELCEKESAAK